MPPVFARSLPNPHPYDLALSGWISLSNPQDRSVAINIMYDHRVSIEREAAFDKLVHKPCDRLDLKRACDHYFKTRVRTRTIPHYVYRAVNGGNIINSASGGTPLIRKDQRLVRVIDLSGLKYVFQWAKYTKPFGSSLSRFPRVMTDASILDWLDQEMTSPHAFIDLVLKIMNAHREEHPFQPTWASMWSGLKRQVKDGPNRWCQMLGVHKPNVTWVILLTYTIAEAGTIARPTQLDGGWYGFHFPSPYLAPVTRGGHPMDLRINPRAQYLLPEFVHRQINHTFDHWTYGGPYFGRTTPLPGTSIIDQRNAHFSLLVRRYGTGITKWMQKVN